MESIIEVYNLSKKYRISHQKIGIHYNTLRDELASVFKKPFYWLGGQRQNREEIWALKDINFKIKPGGIFGVIGPNGAGKTTLLKILTRIMPPTQGKAIIRGKVGSLLEVGTGFHPELTGRENIYLNGAILGMSKKEIDRKFDKIVEFAGVAKFLDTPAKRYSTGMYVRLAFSVAAHLETDILLVDEILSVGDVAFQRKSLAEMQKITHDSKRTIFFVSHNMGAVQKLCKKCILLESGEIKMMGDTKEVVSYYLKSGIDTSQIRKMNRNEEITIRQAFVINEKNERNSQVELGKNFKVKVRYDVNKEVSDAIIFIQIISNNDNKSLVFSADVDADESLLQTRKTGQYEVVIGINNLFLNVNNYTIRIAAAIPGCVVYDDIRIPLEVIEVEKFSNVSSNFDFGSVVNKLKWNIKKL